MHNDVSFFVHRARDLGRVGSRPSQISFLHGIGAAHQAAPLEGEQARRPARCTNFDRVTGNLSKRSRR